MRITLRILTGVVGSLVALVYLTHVALGKLSIVMSFTAVYPLLRILQVAISLTQDLPLRQGVDAAQSFMPMLLLNS